MQVDGFFAAPVRLVAAAAPGLVLVGTSAGVVNGFPVGGDPLAHGQEGFSLFRVERAQRRGSDVVKQVAVLDGVVDQEFDGGFHGLGLRLGGVGPVARPAGAGDVRHGHAAFPGRFVVERPQLAFRRQEISFQVVGQRTLVASAGAVHAVVDQNVRLVLLDAAHHGAGIPLVEGAVAQAVEPQHVHLPVAGEQFTDLAEVVFQVAVVLVGQVVGVVPVPPGVVEAQPEPCRMDRRRELPHDILAVGGIGDGEGVVVGGEVGEAVVVLGGQHGIFHAAFFGDGHPLPGIVLFGIEAAVGGVIFKVHDVFMAACAVLGARRIAFPADFPFQQGRGVPVDKEAEFGVPEPF